MFTHSCCQSHYHSTIMSTVQERSLIVPWKPAELYFIFWKRKEEQNETQIHKKGRDHATNDCNIGSNTRTPLRIQVLTQRSNIKGNSEAWNKMNATASVKYTTPQYRVGYFLLRCHSVNLSASSNSEIYSIACDKTVNASDVKKTLQWSRSLRFRFGA